MIEKIKEVLQRNKLKKFLSLVVAAALWFFVMSSQNPVTNGSYNVKVSMANVPREYKALFREQEVKVKLSAQRSYFMDYNDSDIRAFANMSGYSEGDFEVPIEISFPKGFELVSIAPETIHVQLDPYVEKQFPAEVIVTGSPKEGSVVGTVKKSSENLTIIGSKTAVDKVKSIIGYVGLSGNEEDFELQVPMTAIDSDGREVQGVRTVPSVITVSVNIEKESVKKNVRIVVDMTPPDGKEIDKLFYSPSEVEITGAQEVIDQIDYLKTESFRIPKDTEEFRESLRLIVPYGLSVNTYEIFVTADIKDKEETDN